MKNEIKNITSDAINKPKPNRKTGFLTKEIFPFKNSRINSSNQTKSLKARLTALKAVGSHPLPLSPITSPSNKVIIEILTKIGPVEGFRVEIGFEYITK